MPSSQRHGYSTSGRRLKRTRRCFFKTVWRSEISELGGDGSQRRERVSGFSALLLIAACTSFVVGSPVRAAEPTATAPQLADGTWLVQARVDSESRYCSDRLVRLTNRQGQLSGAVAFARASAPIRNLALLPNGSFSGATRGGVAGAKLGRFYKVTGKFSGDAVSVTLEGVGCPPRHGTAIRQAKGG